MCRLHRLIYENLCYIHCKSRSILCKIGFAYNFAVDFTCINVYARRNSIYRDSNACILPLFLVWKPVTIIRHCFFLRILFFNDNILL